MGSGLPQPDPPEEAPHPLLLASASPTRRRMLQEVGIDCEAVPAAIDEAGVKASYRAEGSTADETAAALAELKALRVSTARPGVLVVGADQILVCDDVWFEKPGDAARARSQLEALRGRDHELVTSVCVALDGAVIWSHGVRARLTMRAFSDDFLADYLVAEGAALYQSVGAYRLEGLGAQLFARVEGDYFAILGLPLLPLLDFLRGHGVVRR